MAGVSSFLLYRIGALLVLAALLGAPAFARAASPAPAFAKNGMVVSSQADATRAGVAMLEAGGNAVDAAIATAFAIGVTQPFSTGIGGGGHPYAASAAVKGKTLAQTETVRKLGSGQRPRQRRQTRRTSMRGLSSQ